MTSRKLLPSGVTSYDLVKTCAVLLMIVDHAGYYFFDGDDWFRVFGRMCVPIWFFLIGYARTRALDTRMWIGAAIMEAGRFAAGMPILPVTILAQFLLTRAVIDRLMNFAIGDNRRFHAVNAALFFAALPSIYLFEYGTPGMGLAMFGWIVRQSQDKNPAVSGKTVNQQFCWAAITFIFWETLTFAFSQTQSLVLSLGVLGIMGGLMYFHSRNYPRLGFPAWTPVRWVLQAGGRWTLEIYVAHIILFQTVASIVDPERFTPFKFVLFPQG